MTELALETRLGDSNGRSLPWRRTRARPTVAQVRTIALSRATAGGRRRCSRSEAHTQSSRACVCSVTQCEQRSRILVVASCRRGQVKHGRGKARRGMARRGAAWLGKAGQGKGANGARTR
jgi:hypothetical protein